MADDVALPGSFTAKAQDFSGKYVQEIMGAVPATSTPISYADATTSTSTIISASTDRISCFVLNVSDTDVWINLGAAAVVDQCFRVPPNYLLHLDSWQGDVRAIHAGTGNKRLILGDFKGV